MFRNAVRNKLKKKDICRECPFANERGVVASSRHYLMKTTTTTFALVAHQMLQSYQLVSKHHVELFATETRG